MTIRTNLQMKITLLLIVILAVTIGANNGIGTALFKKQYLSALQEHGIVIAQSLKNQIDRIHSLGLSVEGLIGFDEQCREIIRRFQEVSLVYVADRQGKVLFSSEGGGKPQQLSESLELMQTVQSGQERTLNLSYRGSQYMASIVPYQHPEQQHVSGSVIIMMKEDIITDKTNTLVQYPLLLSLFFFIVSFFVLSFALTRWVTKPLGRIVSMMKEVSVGNLSVRVPVRGKDEIAQTGSAFNNMAGQLDELMKKAAMAAELEANYQYELQQKEMANKLREIYYSLSSTLDMRELHEKVKAATLEMIDFEEAALRLIDQGNNAELFLEPNDERLMPQTFELEGKYALKGSFLIGQYIGGEIVLVRSHPFAQCDINLAFTFFGQVGVFFQNALYYQKLHELAVTDALTGIYNRRRGFELAEEALAEAHAGGMPVGVMMFDIDHFKQLNDSCGHQFGDQVLKAVVDAVRIVLKEHNDLLLRYGGEEFMVLQRNASPELLLQTAERIRSAIENMNLSWGGKPRGVTVSLGAAVMTEETHTLEAIAAQADQALYQAKQQGRNRVCLWQSDSGRI